MILTYSRKKREVRIKKFEEIKTIYLKYLLLYNGIAATKRKKIHRIFIGQYKKEMFDDVNLMSGFRIQKPLRRFFLLR